MRFVDGRLGAARGIRFLLDYVFPDHWSFLLGEIALYSFIVLVVTGTFLALFFGPTPARSSTTAATRRSGPQVSAAYRSALLSFTVKGGLLMRQTHHWAALVFIAAITLHLLRIVFTGAFRKPRELNYLIGVTMLALALLEGFGGYSLPDDLLSGMGLAIAWGVAMSIPLVGGPFATALWGGVFPGSTAFESRLYIVHVFILPLAARRAHRRAPGDDHDPAPQPVPRSRPQENNVVGTPMWPGYALRSLGLFAFVAAVLFLMGGLMQINPIWLWGPYHTYIGTNGAQPDWYLGWLIGALRMMPNLEIGSPATRSSPTPSSAASCSRRSCSACSTRCPGSTAASSRATTVPPPARPPARQPSAHRPRRRRALKWSSCSSPGPPTASSSIFGYGYQGAIWFFRGAFLVVPVTSSTS